MWSTDDKPEEFSVLLEQGSHTSQHFHCPIHQENCRCFSDLFSLTCVSSQLRGTYSPAAHLRPWLGSRNRRLHPRGCLGCRWGSHRGGHRRYFGRGRSAHIGPVWCGHWAAVILIRGQRWSGGGLVQPRVVPPQACSWRIKIVQRLPSVTQIHICM